MLKSDQPDQTEAINSLLEEGLPFQGVEVELTHLRDVLKIGEALKWKKRVLSLLESKADVASLRAMITSSKSLEIEATFIDALQKRIDELVQGSNTKKKREVPPEFDSADSPKKRGRKKCKSNEPAHPPFQSPFSFKS